MKYTENFKPSLQPEEYTREKFTTTINEYYELLHIIDEARSAYNTAMDKKWRENYPEESAQFKSRVCRHLLWDYDIDCVDTLEATDTGIYVNGFGLICDGLIPYSVISAYLSEDNNQMNSLARAALDEEYKKKLKLIEADRKKTEDKERAELARLKAKYEHD